MALIEKRTINIGENNTDARLYVEFYDNATTQEELKPGDMRLFYNEQLMQNVLQVWYGEPEGWMNSFSASVIDNLSRYLFTEMPDPLSTIIRILNNDPMFDEKAYLEKEVGHGN